MKTPPLKILDGSLITEVESLARWIVEQYRKQLPPGVELNCSATNTFETTCLQHYFQNTAHANVGDATGVRGSTVAGSFYISLHTGDPGETGDQTTSEAGYTSYARVAVARSGAAWTVTGDTASNAAIVTFPACTGSSSTCTYFGIGSDATLAGNLFFSGALTTSLAVSNGITPSFAIGALTVTSA
jgi:hypothetical protein